MSVSRIYTPNLNLLLNKIKKKNVTFSEDLR